MPLEKVSTYQVQSEVDKKKFYDVVLKPQGFWIDAECSCPDWQCQKHKCQHIKRALTCYQYGL